MSVCCGQAGSVFPHTFSVYHANSTQNEYGEIERTFALVATHKCLVSKVRNDQYQVGTIGNYAPVVTLKSPAALVEPGLVFNEILIAQIKDASGKLMWPEPHGGTDANTIFELSGYEPVADVDGTLSHYKYTIVRADAQRTIDIEPWV